MSNPVTGIANAITEGFKLLSKVMSGAEKRRMRAAIEVAEKFIRRWEKKTVDKKKDKILAKYAEKFFKYNN